MSTSTPSSSRWSRRAIPSCAACRSSSAATPTAAASYEARVYGIFSGMALGLARRLCPHAIFLRGDYHEYERVSHAFHRILRDYSPLVERGGLEEAYLDLT